MVKPLDKYFTQHKSTALIHSPDQNWITDLEIDLSKSTDSLFIPKGTDDERRYVTDDGQIRFNTSNSAYEVTANATWTSLAVYGVPTASQSYLALPSGPNLTNTTVEPGAIRYNETHGVVEAFSDRWRPTTRVYAAPLPDAGVLVWDSYFEIIYLDLEEDVTVETPLHAKSGQSFTLIVKQVGAGVLTFGADYVLTRNEANTQTDAFTVYKFDCVGGVMVGHSA